jgi:hypothetical protein
MAYYSPIAGREIFRLSNALLTDFMSTRLNGRTPGPWEKKEMYSSVKVPVLMINGASDTTIALPECDFFVDSLNGPKANYELPGESHTAPPKAYGDSANGSKDYNKDFSGMLDKINLFLDTNFPASNER